MPRISRWEMGTGGIEGDFPSLSCMKGLRLLVWYLETGGPKFYLGQEWKIKPEYRRSKSPERWRLWARCPTTE